VRPQGAALTSGSHAAALIVVLATGAELIVVLATHGERPGLAPPRPRANARPARDAFPSPRQASHFGQTQTATFFAVLAAAAFRFR